MTETGTDARAIEGLSRTPQVGFDFNNILDAARIVSTADDNLVYFPADTARGNPNAGTVIEVTDLA